MIIFFSHGFLSSRVLSLKADQGAVSEKLRISEEYTSSLQTKMEELYRIRDAWSRRYVDEIMYRCLYYAVPLPGWFGLV